MENINKRIENLLILNDEGTKIYDLYESEKKRIEQNIINYLKYDLLRYYEFINIYVDITTIRGVYGEKYIDSIEIRIYLLAKSKLNPTDKVSKMKVTKIIKEAINSKYCPYVNKDIKKYFINKYWIVPMDKINNCNLKLDTDGLIKKVK